MSERKKAIDDRACLTLRQDFYACPAAYDAHAALLRDVFGISSKPRNLGPTWRPIAYFDERGRCVASLETCELTLAFGEILQRAAGLRLVCVAADWRGHGLFRALMEQAMAACADRAIEMMLLFTADPELYRRFGFEPIAQHAFAGVPPAASPAAPARSLDPANDKPLVDRLLADRAPVSGNVALLDAPSLFCDKVEGDDDLSLAYLPDDDALLVYEIDDDTLVLADIASKTVPTLARVLGALPRAFSRVVTLFPPDKLEWSAARPFVEETGLMARGPVPAAMQRPFILPPTAEF